MYSNKILHFIMTLFSNNTPAKAPMHRGGKLFDQIQMTGISRGYFT